MAGQLVLESLLPFALFVPFAAGLAAGLAGERLGRRAGYWLAAAFVPALLATLAAPSALRGEPLGFTLPWVDVLGLELSLRADGFSLLFSGIVGVIGVLTLVYAAAYLAPAERYARFNALMLAFGGSMIGLVLADNLIALFAFWELTSYSSFLLIGFWDRRVLAREGAMKALLVTGLGGLALLAATVLLGQAGGSYSLAALDPVALAASPLFLPALALVLLAAFTKSAQLPFHLWLPSAMEAPTPVSAFLHSATMVKAGVVLVAKFSFLLNVTVFGDVALYVGLLTLLWGAYLALRQTDLKALLAYSTVSQLGLLTALFAAGEVVAGSAHLINHAAFKAALFLVVGIVDHQLHSRDLTRLRGLARSMPFTAIVAVIAALSMAGVPPLGGFISKELAYEAMLARGPLPMALVVLGSAMTFAYSLRFLGVFFGSPQPEQAAPVKRPALALFMPLVPLAVAVVAFGALWPQNTLAGPLVALGAAGFGVVAPAMSLWHGLSVALAWTVFTYFAGTAMFVGHQEFARLQERLTPRWNANTVYGAVIAGTRSFAEWFTRRTQDGPFAGQLRVLFLAVGVVAVAGAARFVPPSVGPVPLPLAMMALLMIAGVVGVLLAKDRVSALILLGLTGFGSSVTFVLLRAPDLALTQILIETVTVILFLSVFRNLPPLARYARPRRRAAVDAVCAGGVGLTLFGLLTAVQDPIAPRLRDFFIEHAKTIGGGNNVVNVILVDIRGYDTLGEITVLAIVAVAVVALLRLRVGTSRDGDDGRS